VLSIPPYFITGLNNVNFLCGRLIEPGFALN
jgi:hypothetical protein